MINTKFVSKVLGKLSSVIAGHKEWVLPDVSKLPDPEEDEKKVLDYEPPLAPETIERVLASYNIPGTFKDFRIGAAVTTYEIEVPMGTRFSQLVRYRDDIARDLGTPSLRIIQSIRDSSLVGFEVENEERLTVHFKQLFLDMPEGLELPVIMGEDTYGNNIYEDLTKMPHMLIAGQTGSGKSVFLNTLIAGLICTKKPEELQFLIVDPKQVEFSQYEDIPHMFYDKDTDETYKVAHDTDTARYLLSVAVDEMEERFKLFRELKVKKISDYNKKAEQKLPYIVFIVDEFADLMMMGTREQKKDVEDKIVRIAQKARAVGIHMILATQKPLATIVTSLIKANMPARISFSVASGIDSRVILDEMGAETLTGHGDMIYRNPNARSDYTRLTRVQAPWLSDSDLEILLNEEDKYDNSYGSGNYL